MLIKDKKATMTNKVNQNIKKMMFKSQDKSFNGIMPLDKSVSGAGIAGLTRLLKEGAM
jgi:hypothetical protein